MSFWVLFAIRVFPMLGVSTSTLHFTTHEDCEAAARALKTKYDKVECIEVKRG